MSEQSSVTRRSFLNRSLAAAGAAGMVAAASEADAGKDEATSAARSAPQAEVKTFPCGTIGKAKISRMLLGGNLISGNMHARDLQYVGSLFRAYATEEKILDTLKQAEQYGINTVFETGAKYVDRYNRECNGHMQFIPHIRVDPDQSEESLGDHIKQQVDSGAVALYVWGVSADQLTKEGKVDQIGRAVEMAKKLGLPVGVGGHSLQVPVQCEKLGVPSDFYVKTLHSDDYPSATFKEYREEFMWMDGPRKVGDRVVWFDNMWCINPEETVAFMQSVTKPWIAFKVLAAGAFRPRQGFQYAFKNGADFIAVGMLDFQIRANCETARQVIRHNQKRERPWRA